MQNNLLLIVIVLLLAWLLVRRRNRVSTKEASQKGPPRPRSTNYHAVSIKVSEKACAAARDLSGRRFLSNAAPRLPLDDCDAAECHCRFAHHDDRRHGKDRRSPFAPAGFGGGTGSFEQERRGRPDRREGADTDRF